VIAIMTSRPRAKVLAGAMLALAVAGCASGGRPAEVPTDYLSRLSTLEEGNIRVSVAALSAEEGGAVYGVPLAEKGIQAVWVEVENKERRAYWLLPAGLDPNYFPASEAAEAFARDALKGDAALEQRFQSLAFQNPAPPGKTSGFLLVNRDEGVKIVHIDLVATGDARSFSFLVPVPGFRADYAANDVFQRIDSSGDAVAVDDEAFRTALESLPCCVSNEKGSKTGDPLNLVIVGGLEDAFPALVRRGWRPTEATWSGSVFKMMTSALKHDRYPYAPVSNLYVYGRRQDLALQKARDNIHQRNHLRLWLSPLRYQGKQVWVGQISRDIGSRLTIHSKTLTTHKIDPDVDEARRALLEDTAYSQSLASFGFVKGVGETPASQPRGNLTNDPWYTDGRRLVLVFDKEPSSLTDIEVIPWEQIRGHTSEPAAEGGGR
jgi:hypothetical protein